MQNFLLVCLGGAAGSGARYLVGTWALRVFGPAFPVGTLIVNTAGSFLIAVVMSLSLRTGIISPSVRLLLTSGVMGGFTTYSSFNHETLRLVSEGSWGMAALNLGVTVLGCLAAGTLGMSLGGIPN